MEKHKFNWIDGMVLVLIAALIAGVCVKFLVLDRTSRVHDTVSFSYQIKISGVRQYAADAILPGDTVYDEESKSPVGVVTDIRTEQSLSTAGFSDGSVARVPLEDRIDIYLTLEAQGVLTGGVYKTGTFPIVTGQSTRFYTKCSAWTGRVFSVPEAIS